MRFDNWREFVQKDLRNYLEKLISDTGEHKGAFLKSKNPAKAQLWISLAQLSKRIYDIETKLSYMEKALKEISPKGKKIEERKRKDIIKKAEKELKALTKGAKLVKKVLRKKK